MFTQVGSGEGFSCGLASDGRAFCWGWYHDGWALPPRAETFVSISVGNRHACGLRADGVTVCWGEPQISRP